MVRAPAFRLAALVALAAGLVAAAVLLLHDASPTSAQATPIVLVSNIDQTTEATISRTTVGVVQAQRFTTGSGAYILSSIEIRIKSNPTQAQRNVIGAHLWSATTGTPPRPNERIAYLTVPPHPIAAGVVKFNAPADTALDPNTNYFLVLFTQNNFNLEIASTTSTAEDASSQTGWSIQDHFQNASGSQGPGPSLGAFGDRTAAVLQIRVNGQEAPAPEAPTEPIARPGDSRLDVVWTKPSGPVTSYDVHYTSSATVDADAALGSDLATEWVDAMHTGTEASHRVTGLTNDTKYRVRVRAENPAGASPWAHAAGIPAIPTHISSTDLPDITLDVDPFYLNERAEATTVTVTAVRAPGSDTTEEVTVTLVLDRAPLLTPGVQGAYSTDYTTTLGSTNKVITIAAGEESGDTSFAIDPVPDGHEEGDQAIVITGRASGMRVSPVDLIIEDGPYLTFPAYIYGYLYYPGATVDITVDETDPMTRYHPRASVEYSLIATEPSDNPLGLTFDPATRKLTGTAPADAAVPTEGITTRYTIQAVETGAGHTATTMVSVAVVKEACLSSNTTLFPAATYPSPSDDLVSDCNVLLAAKDTLRGTSGNLNWATDTAINAWDGIHERFYDPDFFADQIAVKGMRLNGTIPPVLGHLSTPKVTWLVLGEDHIASPVAMRNKLTGPIPPELGIPPNLSVLALGDNNHTGPIPRELAIPRELGKPTPSSDSRLFHLYLYNNDLSGPIPPELGNLALRGLNLFGNPKVTGHIPWQLAKNRPGQARVSGHAQHGLQILHLHQNGLTGNIPWQLGRFGKIQSLALSGNELTGSIPWQLGNLGKDEAGLERRIITGLYLNDNMLTGPIPPQLSNISNLRTLSLGENRLTGAIPWELGNLSTTKFQNLFLHINQLSGEIPAQLGELSSMVYLYLSCNDLDGSVPGSIGGIATLKELRVFGNPRLDLDSIMDRAGLTVTRTGDCPTATAPPDPTPTPTPTPTPPTTPPTTTTGGGFGGGGPVGNQAPRFAEEANVVRSVDENSPSGTAVGDAVTATDPDGDQVRYRLIGADRALFDIDADTGQITVAPGTALDFEGERNVYSVRVVALDVAGSGSSNEVAVAVQVADVKLPGKADDYDVAGNHNEALELAETIAAVRDYFDGRLSLDEVVFIVRYYFSN